MSVMPESLVDGVVDMADVLGDKLSKTTELVADTLDAVFASHSDDGKDDEEEDEFIISTRVDAGVAIPKTALNFFGNGGMSYEVSESLWVLIRTPEGFSV
jgi:hypothetical protein